MSAATATRSLGLFLVGAGWAAALGGLFLLPVAADPEFDLDAGPSFALNLSVYLPAVAMTVLLLVALPVAVAARAGAVVGAAAAVAVSVFALWVLAHQELLNYLPGMRACLWLAIGLAGAGLAAFCAAAALRRGSVTAEELTSALPGPADG